MRVQSSLRLDSVIDELPIVGYEVAGPRDSAVVRHDELKWVAKAVQSRRDEFATGRACARAALSHLGLGTPSIPVGLNREPVWPTGAIGSISHTENYCLAVGCRSGGSIRGLGVDAEQHGRIRPDTYDLLFGAAEQRAITSSGTDADAIATRIFSAKESFFKAQFPITRRWIGFHDVVATVDPHSLDVMLSAVDDTLLDVVPAAVKVSCVELHGVVVTIVTL